MFNNDLKLAKIKNEFPGGSSLQYTVRNYAIYLPGSETLIIDGKFITTADENDKITMNLKNMCLSLVDNSISDINCCLWSLYHEYRDQTLSEDTTKIKLPIDITTCFGLPFYNRSLVNADCELEKLRCVRQTYLNDRSLIIGDEIECYPITVQEQSMPVLTLDVCTVDNHAKLIWKLINSNFGVFLNEFISGNTSNPITTNYSKILLQIQRFPSICPKCNNKSHFSNKM